MCNKTKGLEEFAKCQKRNPDNAVCIFCLRGISKCVNKVIEVLQVHRRTGQQVRAWKDGFRDA
jgi:hypothetical protein